MTVYREATEADEGGEFRDVVLVEPDHTILMCEYCLCFIDKDQKDEACWNCGAHRVRRFALYGIGGDDE